MFIAVVPKGGEAFQGRERLPFCAADERPNIDPSIVSLLRTGFLGT